MYGGSSYTTNNQMELTAAIKALNNIDNTYPINIYTDSKYVFLGITNWIVKWKLSKNTLIKNYSLWIQLDKLNQFHKIHWYWVQGHSGNIYNEKADQIARKIMQNYIKNN